MELINSYICVDLKIRNIAEAGDMKLYTYIIYWLYSSIVC